MNNKNDLNNKEYLNKDNNLIEIPQGISKSKSKEKYAYIFKVLKQSKVFKKYIIVTAVVTEICSDKIHLIIKTPEFNDRKAICLKENYGDMSKKDVDYIFRLGSKHKFIVVSGTENNDLIYLNYKGIHPEVNLSSSRLSPTISHYWNIKMMLNKTLQEKKEVKSEKNSNNSWK